MNLGKTELRKSFKAKIAENKSNSDLKELSHQLETLMQKNSGTWGAFAALSDEPAVEFSKLSTSVRWVYPRIEGEHIQFYQAPAAELKANNWGIAEPDPAKHQAVKVNELSGVCVPGLAFDKDCYRLGRGKGYYDRALSGFTGKKVGVAFSWQIAEASLPRESFDIPMDIVVTEKSIIHRELAK